MNRLFFKLLLCASLICANAGPNNCAYGKELVLNDRKIFDFASFLYRKGEYYRAVSEYQRLTHFFPDSPLKEKSILQIGKAHMAGGEFQEAISHWQKQLKNIKLKDENQFRIKILLGLSFLDMDGEKPYSLRKGNVQSALRHFSQVPSQLAEAERIKSFTEDWKSRDLPPRKSPWIAGCLSAIVPGSGSFYAGRYMEGVYAFFITGLFYLATMEALGNEKEELAYVFGFFTLTFYGGGIYTAINGAHRINDKMETDELLRLRKKHGIWFIPDNNRHEGRF